MTRLWLRYAVLVAMLLLPAQGCVILHRPTGIRIALNVDYANFPKFEREVGRVPGVQSWSSPSGTTGISLSAESQRAGWEYFFGSSLRYGSHDFEQRFQPGLGGPISTEGRVNGWFFDAYGGRRWPLGARSSFDLLGGPVLAYNDATIDYEYADGIRGVNRSHTSAKFRVGTAFNHQFGNRFGLRGGLDYVGLFNSDADDHTRFSIGVTHRFGGYSFSRSPVPSRREARHAR